MIDATLLPISDNSRSLRPLTSNDAHQYVEGTCDPLVQKFGHLPESEYTAESVIRLAREDVPAGLERGDLAVLSIVDSADIFLGSLVMFDATTTSAEVGFWLHPDARGSGHAVGALKLAAVLGARSGLVELTARTLTENVSSQRCLEQAGFQLTAEIVDRTPAGDIVPLAHYRRPLSNSTKNAGNAY